MSCFQRVFKIQFIFHPHTMYTKGEDGGRAGGVGVLVFSHIQACHEVSIEFQFYRYICSFVNQGREEVFLKPLTHLLQFPLSSLRVLQWASQNKRKCYRGMRVGLHTDNITHLSSGNIHVHKARECFPIFLFLPHLNLSLAVQGQSPSLSIARLPAEQKNLVTWYKPPNSQNTKDWRRKSSEVGGKARRWSIELLL